MFKLSNFRLFLVKELFGVAVRFGFWWNMGVFTLVTCYRLIGVFSSLQLVFGVVLGVVCLFKSVGVGRELKRFV